MTGPSLLLLHGLGATSGVWADVRDRLDRTGRVIAPDLNGHGAAPWTGEYSIGGLAAGVSAHCQPGEKVIIVGHSLGGAVGLCLASGFFAPRAVAVIGLGIKVNWSDEDVAAVAKVAANGIRWMDTEAEAVDRYLRQSGLAGLVDTGHASVTNAVVAQDGRWRVTQDPATYAQSALDTRGLLDAATCPVVLGAGEHDPMVDRDELAAYVHRPRQAAGCGHNVQVENPAWVVELLTEVEAGLEVDHG